MSETSAALAAVEPHVATLQPLVGTWSLSGDSSGTVTYEWMEGGHFLVQRFDIVANGDRATGVEYIGRLRRFGEEPSDDLHSRVYGTDGSTLDYVYELDGHVLTIWAVEKGSPAYFRGTFCDDWSVNEGAWVYPGGGGYTSTMTRVA